MRAKDTTVVIIGCGAAGVTAAIGLARRKIPTIVVEGALYPGAENWSGAVYFCENLVRPEILGPKAIDQTAIERKVVKRGMLLCDGRVAVGGAIHSRAAFEHCYTVLRPVFDHDLAQRARLLGAEILSDTTATALIRDGDRVLGVLTDRGPIYADLVFLAEGDASNLVTREGLERKPAGPRGLVEPSFLQGIKEVVALDPKLIESRFGIAAGEGACFEILLRNASLGGRPVQLNAGAFLYTNRESVSIGIVAPLETLAHWSGDHNRLMEWMKQLPAIAPLIAGGETISFGAKVIRGGGFKEMPRLVLDGLAVGGAAAGLGVDFPCPNYTGPATYCGFLLSEAVHALTTAQRPLDAAGLTEHYVRPLEASHYFADTKHLAEWPHFVATTREFFGRQVDLAAGAAHVLTAREFGSFQRHFLFARFFFETVRGKVGILRHDAAAASAALGAKGLEFFRNLPRWIVNVVLGFFPRRARTDASFTPLFWGDPGVERRRPPLGIRFLRWRFATSAGDALFHLYRNDPVPLGDKVRAGKRALLSRLSILDFLLLPLLFAFNWVVGFLHQLGFKLWVAIAKPSLARILKTPFYRVREGARAIADASAASEAMGHDDKLALITYKGEKKSHIDFHVAYDPAGLPEVASPVFHVCPANVYRQDQDQSLAPSVTVLHENCVRCETCWRADPLHVDWGRTGAQRLVFEAYSPAEAWLTEALEAASLGARPPALELPPLGAQSVSERSEDRLPRAPGEESGASRDRVGVQGPGRPLAEREAPGPEVAASPAILTLLSRARSSAAAFRPLHDRLPPVLLGGDQDLLDRVAGDALSALESLDADLRPAADAALLARLDALAAFRALTTSHRTARRYFHVEADFALLEAHHLPELEALLGTTGKLRTGVPPRPAPSPKTRADLRRALESRLTKEVLHESDREHAPSAAAVETIRWLLRGLLQQGGTPAAPGSPSRDLVLEELARLSPALALLAAGHLAALDCVTRFKVEGDPEDLGELLQALGRVRALAAVVDSPFALEEGETVSGTSAAMALGGVQLLVLPLAGEEVAVVGRGDPGVEIETPGSLGLDAAGLSRLTVASARPRARFRRIKARPWLQVYGALDTVAIVRGAAQYLRARALDHAASRVQFPGLFRDLRGRDGIAKFGAVQAMLAEIEAATLLLESLRGQTTHGAGTAALAADLLGPGPRSIAYLAGQVLGGTAYSEEDPVCRFFRDAATLTRVPIDAELAARAHGRRQLELARGAAGDASQLLVGLHLQPLGFEDRPGDPADLGARLAAVRDGFRELEAAIGASPPGSLDGIAGDLGRLALLAGAFALFVDDVRAARARGEVGAREDAACEHWAHRIADRARRLARRLPDCLALIDLGRRLLEPGAAEGPAGAAGATYVDYLDDAGRFASGDLFARPAEPGALAFSPELLEADPILGHADASTRATYRDRWRDRRFDGIPYSRLLERLHHIPLQDVEWLVTSGHFRQTIPASLGGLGRLKAQYYVSCVNLMRHGDPAHALLVMGSTSIGTTPITIGLDQDLPAARKAIEKILAKPEAVRDVDARIARLLEMSATADALKIEAPFQELMGIVKKTLQSEKVLRLAFQDFLDAFMAAGRAGLKKDLAGFQKHLGEARSRLAGFEKRLEAERDALPHREAMHRFWLQSISAGRISGFALTEPSAGSDTARIRTRAAPVEVEATPDPRGFWTFVPAGGTERRNLFGLDRLEFADGRLVFLGADGERHPVETRDFSYEAGDGPSKFRYVTLGGERVDVHDMGRVVSRDGRSFYPYFRVDGAKMWITNGSVAGVLILYARTERGPTGFMLDTHQEGLIVGKDEAKMGQRGSTTNELALKDVRIPADAIIGIEGRGQENALETLNVGRAGLSITAVGLMHEIANDVREAFERQGRAPGSEDLRQLGKMALDLVGSESLAYSLCGRFDHHGTQSTRVESAVGKAETSEALHRMLRRAERIAGPSAVLAESELEKRRRDARVLTIYEGTNEVQRFLVLKDLIDVLPAEVAPLGAVPGETAGLGAQSVSSRSGPVPARRPPPQRAPTRALGTLARRY